MDLHEITYSKSWSIAFAFVREQPNIILPDYIHNVDDFVQIKLTPIDKSKDWANFYYNQNYPHLDTKTKTIQIRHREYYTSTKLFYNPYRSATYDQGVENTVTMQNLRTRKSINCEEITLDLRTTCEKFKQTIEEDVTEENPILLRIATSPKVGITLKQGIKITKPIQILVNLN